MYEVVLQLVVDGLDSQGLGSKLLVGSSSLQLTKFVVDGLARNCRMLNHVCLKLLIIKPTILGPPRVWSPFWQTI